MALEQVSPAAKDNQPAKIFRPNDPFGANLFSGGISLDGDRVLFLSLAPLGGTNALLSAFGDRYVATRDSGDQRWVTSATSPPDSLVKGWGETPHPREFSADFSSWFQIASTASQFTQEVSRVFHGGIDTDFQPVSPLLIPTDGILSTLPGSKVAHTVESGASADHSRLYFVPGPAGGIKTTYLPGDPLPEGPGSRKNTYVALLDASGNPSLELLALDRDGKVWGGNCGARIGAGNGIGVDADVTHNRGAISADGSRVYFTTRPAQPASGSCLAASKSRIMEREETATGPKIEELFQSECDRVAAPGPPEVFACGKTADGLAVPPGGNTVPDSNDVYQAAAVDGSRLYFTTSRQLTNSDLNGLDEFGVFSGCVGASFELGGCDLYLYDSTRAAGQRLTQVTTGSNGRATPLVAATSGDGSRVYFISTEALAADPGPGGSAPQAGQLNLYLFERGAASDRRAFVGVLAAGELNPTTYPVPVLEPEPPVVGAAGGDGRVLVFASKAPLTVDDIDGGRTDVFRYDAVSGQLVRISKAAQEGSDNGAFDVATGFGLGIAGSSDDNSPAYAVQGRWVSEDGETIAFKTAEGLVADDINGVLDSYVWRAGKLFGLPGSTDPTGELEDKPVVSIDGQTIAYMSFQQLLPSDGDTAADVYVVRGGGGSLPPVAPVPCAPDGKSECQGPAAPSPANVDAASRTVVGRGNLASGPNKRPPCRKGKRRAKRNGKGRCIRKVKRTHRIRHIASDRKVGR